LVVGNFDTSAKLSQNHDFSIKMRKFLSNFVKFLQILMSFRSLLNGFEQKSSSFYQF